MSNRPLLYILVLVCGVVLAGCGVRPSYYHPKKPAASWDKDLSHCRDTAKYLLETGRGLSGGGMQEEVKDCMQAKGYRYGADAPPIIEEASASASDTAQTEYNVLESTWHTEQLALQRLDYLRRTNIQGAFVRSHQTADGTWYRVLIGSRETLSGAKNLQYRLWNEHNLRYTYIVKRN